MNDANLDRVVQGYIERFDEINNDKNREYFKWEAFRHFADHWDMEAPNFAEMLKESMRLTGGLIDNSRVCPTAGMIKLAEREELTEKIRTLFKALFADDGADIKQRQGKIEQFRDDVNALLQKYEPGKWKYNQEFRTVLAYVNMHCPSRNYLYKATQAHEFMNYMEFEDDFGHGMDFDLSRYYRMCDCVVEKIKHTPELTALHNERLTDAMLIDDDYHLLAFDIIYCAVVYNLYAGLPLVKRTKKTAMEKQRNAIVEQKSQRLHDAQIELNEALAQEAQTEDVSIVGLPITHRTYGKGQVVAQNQGYMIARFDVGDKEFTLPNAFSAGFLTCEECEVMETMMAWSKRKAAIDSLRSTIRRLAMDIDLL